MGAHTRYEDLAALPETLRRKMHLIHVTDAFAAARAGSPRAGDIPILEEGALYEVTPAGAVRAR